MMQSQQTGTTMDVFVKAAELLGFEQNTIVPQLLEAITILLGTFLLLVITRLIKGAVERTLGDDPSIPLVERDQRARTLAQLTIAAARAVIILTGFLLFLNVFFNIAPILASVGVLGLAVSFGAQSMVKDMIAGFFILFEDQIRVGDVVAIAGVSGVVERITLRIIVLRDLEAVVHVIPNGEVGVVSNKTRSWSRVVMDVGVAYGENVDHVIEVLKDLLAHFVDDADWGDSVQGDAGVWGVQDLSDSSVNVRVVIETKPGRQWTVRREMLRRIKLRFDKEGIEIPFPQRTVHMRGSPPAQEKT